MAVLQGAAQEQLTEVERLRLEIVDLQYKLTKAYADTDACRIALAPFVKRENEASVQAARAKLKAEIEAAHPCCTLDDKTGVLVPRQSSKN